MKRKKRNNKNKKRKILIFLIVIIVIVGVVVILGTQKKSEEELIQTSKGENKKLLKPEIDSSLTDWNLILVNKENKIPEGYKVELKNIGNGHKVDARILKSIQQMLEDMKKDGLNPIIGSSYRAADYQKKLFKNKVDKYAKQGYSKEESEEKASFWVAIPRTSEHEIGLALDIVSKTYQVLDEKQASTKEQKWLKENSYRYGFILRYEQDKQDKTKINHEPWHYRYVGVENATFMKENKMCLEEYIEYLKGE